MLFGNDLKTYARALQQFSSAKQFSSRGSGDKRHPHAIVLLDENSDGIAIKCVIPQLPVLILIYSDVTVWPDPSLGLLGPKDLRMPLPGNVGFSRCLKNPTTPQNLKKSWQDSELLCMVTNYERQVQIVRQSAQEDVDELNSTEIEELLLDLPQPSDVLECVAQDCPKLIRKGKNHESTSF